MAYSIETGGFAIPQQAPAADNFTALSGLRPLQFGSSPIQIKPLERWQIPTDGMSKGITEGVSGALKGITAAYIENKKEERADKREDKKLAQQLYLDRSKESRQLLLEQWKETNALQRDAAKMQNDILLERIKAGRSSEPTVDTNTASTYDAAIRVAKASGATDDQIKELEKRRDASENANARLKSVLPVETINKAANQSVIPGGEAWNNVPLPTPSKTPTDKSASPDALELIPSGEPKAPQFRIGPPNARPSRQPRPGTSEEVLSLTDLPVPTPNQSLAVSPALSGAIPVVGGTAPITTPSQFIFGGVTVGAYPPVLKSKEEQEIDAKVADIMSKPHNPLPPFQKVSDVLASQPTASQFLSASTTREEAVAKSQVASAAKDAADKSAVDAHFSQPTPPGEPSVNIYKSGKGFALKEIPVEKKHFRPDDLQSAQIEAGLLYEGYGLGKISYDDKTRTLVVTRSRPDAKLEFNKEKQRLTSLWGQQSGFNKQQEVIKVQEMQGPLTSFMHALHRTQDPSNKAINTNDMDLIDNYVKLTKGGQVTETQVHLIKDSKALNSKFEMIKNRVFNGGLLTSDERKEMVSVLADTHNSAAERANQYITSKRKQLSIDHPEIAEEFLPHYFPLIRTAGVVAEEKNAHKADVLRIAEEGNKAKARYDSEKDLQKKAQLRSELSSVGAKYKASLGLLSSIGEEEKQLAAHNGIPNLPVSKYPKGWPSYWARGLSGSGDEGSSSSENSEAK